MGKRTGNPIGRPTKWNPKVKAAILEATIRYGHRRIAANHAGISYDLLMDWIAKGREENPDAEFLDFIRALEQAEDAFLARQIATIESHGKRDWRAPAWLAERMRPADFAPKAKVEHTGKEGGPLEYVVKWDQLAETP